MATISSLLVELGVDSKNLEKGLAKASGKITSFASVSTLAMAGGVAAIAVGVGMIAQHAFDMGVQFDAVLDGITTATGATGTELEALGDSVLSVYTEIPVALDDVGIAIGALNAQLDLTGGPLEAVATQVLELSRITGTDLTGNIASVADAMAKWNIPASEISGHLDEIFRASQASGASVSTLSGLLATNKAVLDSFNFSLPEAVSLLALMEKGGINTSQAMMGLKSALAKFASEGVTDAKAALFELIEQIKSAPDDMTATAIAIDYFGQRAGPELAGAIRSGNFEIGAMLDLVANGEATIIGTAEATNDFGEKFDILKNRANALLIPLGTFLVEALTQLADGLLLATDWLGKGRDAFNQLPAPIQTVVETLLKLLNPFTRIQEAIRLNQQAWESFKVNVLSRVTELKDQALTKFEALKTGITEKITTLRDGVSGIIGAIKVNTVEKFEQMSSSAVGVVIMMGYRLVSRLYGFVGDFASAGSAMMSGLVSGITGALGSVVSAVVGAVSDAYEAGKNWLLSRSPSKRFAELGETVGSGLALGIDRSSSLVKAASKELAVSSTIGFDGSGTGGGGSVINNYYSLKSDELIRLFSNAETGGEFARSFGHEMGLR